MNELKNKVREAVAANKVKDSLSILKNNLDSSSSKINLLTAIRRNYNTIQTEWLGGIVKEEEYGMRHNKLTARILEFLDLLEAEDLNTESGREHSVIKNPLLIIGNPETNPREMKKLFEVLRFELVDFYKTGDPIPANDQYRLIIFDNTDLPVCPSPDKLSGFEESIQEKFNLRIALWKDFLEKTNYFFIHYGEYFYWINKNRERIHAANSRFALYSRVKEMLDFIYSYRV